jgi:hypothetical protein
MQKVMKTCVLNLKSKTIFILKIVEKYEYHNQFRSSEEIKLFSNITTEMTVYTSISWFSNENKHENMTFPNLVKSLSTSSRTTSPISYHD